MNRWLLCLSLLTANLYAAGALSEEPQGQFARGEKLPGDLTDILDGDKSGKISDAEVKAAIEQFKKEANAAEKTERGENILQSLDGNKDGKLDDAEAVQGAVAARMQQGGASDAVAKVFRRLDADNNGFITANEYGKLQAIVGLFNPDAGKKLAELFQALDVNQDRAISFVESQLAADLFAESGGFAPKDGGGGGQAPARNAKIEAFVKATFAKRDRDEDGVISAIESRRDPALRREFAAADASGDGKLTPEELYAYLEKKFAGAR